MAIIKCKMCGGDLEVVAESRVAVCEYCGTQQTVPSADNEKKLTLFGRANRLRMACEFDKAAGVYESIVADFPEEAEAYWGLVLCKYGIEYVDDPATGKKIPTCHRSSFDSVMDDSNLDQALENADAIARRVYRDEAKAIEDLRKGIIEVSGKEDPYDIFICYKETDDNGDRTIDSVIAQEVYDALTEKGYRVFFSRITLEDKLGQEYEPYIFAALHSAKIMLAFGTDYEYYNAVWVKNEWSRFLQLIAAGEKKTLIPCYKNIDAYDMPKEFARLQAQDMGKVGAMQDLLRGIEKILPRERAVVKETVVVQQSAETTKVQALLERAFLFLEDGDWNAANEYCEKALDIDPKCAEGYLGKLMIDLKVTKREDLENCAEPFDENGNYQKVIRFGAEAIGKELQGYLQRIKNRIEKARIEAERKAEEERLEAERRAEEARAKKEREKAKAAYEQATETFAKYSDAAYTNAARVEHISEAIATLEPFSDYRDAKEKIEEYTQVIKAIGAKGKTTKKKTAKILAVIGVAIVMAVAAFLIISKVIVPGGKYDSAMELMEKGEFEEAYVIFRGLDYKDSATRAEVLLKENPSIAQVGDCLVFGTYEQDNNVSNGKETIEWIVLTKEDGKLFVISKYALAKKPYNNSLLDVTWETCTLRNWLNTDFYNEAFDIKEQAAIQTVTVPEDSYPTYSTTSGKATQDKIFILSASEADSYFTSSYERRCFNYPGSQAVDREQYWWLRTPGKTQSSALLIFMDGRISARATVPTNPSPKVTEKNAVRPAMWIDLSE